MEELIRTFDAYDDAGTKHRLWEYQNVISAPNRDNPHHTVRGLKTFRTREGLHVNVLEEGRRYEIVQTGVQLTVR